MAGLILGIIALLKVHSLSIVCAGQCEVIPYEGDSVKIEVKTDIDTSKFGVLYIADTIMCGFIDTQEQHIEVGHKKFMKLFENTYLKIYVPSSVEVKELNVMSIAGEARIGLDTVNAEGMEIISGLGTFKWIPRAKLLTDRIEVNAGMGEVKVDSISMKRLRNIEVNAGMGKAFLGFVDQPEKQVDAEINVGFGKVLIYIPRGLTCSLEKSSFLGFISYECRRKMLKKDAILNLEINTAFGVIKIKARD